MSDLSHTDIVALRNPDFRKSRLAEIVFRHAHNEIKSRAGGVRAVVMFDIERGGTSMVELDNLSETDLLNLLPSQVRARVRETAP